MKVKKLKVPLPPNKYFSRIEVKDSGIEIEAKQKKRVALLFIALNHQYWPYLKTVLEDAQKHFLPHHKVDFFVWTDIEEKDTDEFRKRLSTIPPQKQLDEAKEFAKTVDDLNEINKVFSKETIEDVVRYVRSKKNISITYTEPIQWPMGTLMRYHLFLQKEEELKGYDYVFYLDADMRIVQKISDEILGEGLTAAEHPMYSLPPRFIPPYEPNPSSTAYINRLGKIEEHNGTKRFRTLYIAGGFQGGTSQSYLKAIRTMRKNIDKDFNRNYTAIWNDESHWNKYVLEHENPADGKPTIVLDPSYIYPDSLIKEYYEPLWGRRYEPKIITLTKPWQTTKEAGRQIRQQIGDTSEPQPILLQNKLQCPHCLDVFQQPNMHLEDVVKCNGKNKPHELKMRPL